MPYKNAMDKKAANDRYRETIPSGYYAKTRRVNAQMMRSSRPFAGCDGEGANSDGPSGKLFLNGHNHQYMLLRIGGWKLHTGNPLSTEEIFEFMCAIRSQPDYRSRYGGQDPIFVGFYFNYDVTMILRDFTIEELQALFDRESRAIIRNGRRESPRPYRWRNKYEIDYLRSKFFKVRKCENGAKWFEISETSGFFQSSFLAALQKWEIGTPEQLEIIERGKLARASFSMEASEEDIYYNLVECRLLEQLMDRLRETTQAVPGLEPKQWQGAGCIAQAMYGYHNTPKRPIIPATIVEAGQYAYFGGRFEVSQAGDIDGPIHEYDIASAYPDAMRSLPCLGVGDGRKDWQAHGYWSESDKVDPTKVYIADVSWETNVGKFPEWGPLPYRLPNSNIFYPLDGRGWYWSYEVEELLKWTDYNVTVHQVYTYTQTCECQPLQWILDYFQERQRIGKGARGIAIKLGLNSLYGKSAQSIGSPQYANIVWAGLITSRCRSRMLRVLRCQAKDVFMVATDGIYLRNEMIEPDAGLDTKELGSWEHAIHSHCFIVAPGVYFLGEADEVKLKTRGFPVSQIKANRQLIIDTWREHKYLARVEIPRTVFMGAKLAAHQRKLSELGEWKQDPRKINFGSMAQKRQILSFDKPFTVPWSRIMYEVMMKVNPGLGSGIYNKRIGDDLDLASWSNELPDDFNELAIQEH